jgi:transposase
LAGDAAMMGVQATSARLFYDFCLDDHVPCDHILRSIDRHLDLDGVRQALKPFYSSTGRPSIDPELMIRMLIAGYCMGIRSEAPIVRGGSSQSRLSLVLPPRSG